MHPKTDTSFHASQMTQAIQIPIQIDVVRSRLGSTWTKCMHDSIRCQIQRLNSGSGSVNPDPDLIKSCRLNFVWIAIWIAIWLDLDYALERFWMSSSGSLSDRYLDRPIQTDVTQSNSSLLNEFQDMLSNKSETLAWGHNCLSTWSGLLNISFVPRLVDWLIDWLIIVIIIYWFIDSLSIN